MDMTYELESSQQASIRAISSQPGGSSKPTRKRTGLHVLLCDKCAAYYFSDEPNCPACESRRGNGSSTKPRRLYSLPCPKCGARYFSDEPNCPVCESRVNGHSARHSRTSVSRLKDGNGDFGAELKATVPENRRLNSSSTKRERLYGLPCEKCGAWYFSDEAECPVCDNRRRDTGTSTKPARLYGMPCEKCGAWYFTDEPECPVCESRGRENGTSTMHMRLYGLPCKKCGAWYFSDEPKCPVCGSRRVKLTTRIPVRHNNAGEFVQAGRATAA